MATIFPDLLEAPHAPAWQALFSCLDDRYDRFHLRRFFSFCSSRGLNPKDLTDADLAAYGVAVDAAGIARPKQVVRDAALTWNRMADAGAGWPNVYLSPPASINRRSLSLADFLASFRADVDAFLHRTGAAELFADRSLKPLSPATQRDRRNKILQIATRAVACGREPATIKKLSDLVEPEIAKQILETLWREAEQQANGHHHNLARLMVLIARHWAYRPPEEVAFLKRAETRFRPKKVGMTPTNWERLRPFTDAANIHRLVNMPMSMIKRLDVARPRISEAVAVQSALAVALLLVAPVRVKNLASIDLERHIHRIGETACLVFPEEEVKNAQPLEYPLRQSTLTLLNLYLRVYRPLLAKTASTKLFISLNGRPKTPAQLGAQIPKFIEEELGLRMHVHLFRHLAGFIYLRNHPGEYETVRQLLGHASIRTTVEFYTGLEHAESFRRYDAILDQYRAEPDHAGSR